MTPSFERSADTAAVINVLRACNDEITYEHLSARSNLALSRMRQVLASARRVIRREDGILFGSVKGKGLKRLDDQAKVKKPEAFKKRVARGARREVEDLGTISNFGALSKTDQHSVTTNRTVLNVIRQQAMVRPEEPSRSKVAPPIADITRLIPRK